MIVWPAIPASTLLTATAPKWAVTGVERNSLPATRHTPLTNSMQTTTTPRFHLTEKSGNVKTGPLPVSTSSNSTCPDACPLKSKGCYASAGGPLALHWRKVSEEGRGDDWATFVSRISALPFGQLWRHNQAGDLPGENNSINVDMLAQLASANEGKRGWTYTHKPVVGDGNEATCNRAAVRAANERGFTINLSADNLIEADELKTADCGPVVVVLPADAPLALTTPAGHKVIVCPAQRPNSAATCATCGLCQKQRAVIVGFLAHGTQAKAASAIAAN